MSVNVLWIKQEGRRMKMSCRFPGNATCNIVKRVRERENVTFITKTYFGLLLPKIIEEKVKGTPWLPKNQNSCHRISEPKEILEIRWSK
jgi:hypothetical protein